MSEIEGARAGASRRERTRLDSPRAPGAWLRPPQERLERRPAGPSLLGRLCARAVAASGRLPLRASHAAGAAAGRALARVPNRLRHATRVNLARAFPELGRRERRRLERASLAHLGRAVAELGALWTRDAEGVRALVRSVEGAEALDAAFARGRGVLLALPHLGSWELAGLWACLRHPVVCVYRAPRLFELDELARRGRGRFGARLLPAGAGAVRAMRRALAQGEGAAMLPDQDAGDGAGIFVPFFGELANTPVLPARLAARAGAAVVVGVALRRPRGEGFDLCYEELDADAASTELERAALALNRAVERCVRGAPEQYLWSYERYRIRPPGMANPYARGGSA